MSVNLKNIMSVKGVTLAVEFDDRGKTVSHEGDMDKKLIDLLSDMFSANLRMARLQAHLFTEESGVVGFGEELTGFAMLGNGLSFCVIENVGVVIENGVADLNEVYEVLANS
ncbi:MAG: DUF2173 family protein [Spirochaetota bacterium]|nr:DUF2173 family protein [Spirochaetota bacterium]